MFYSDNVAYMNGIASLVFFPRGKVLDFYKERDKEISLLCMSLDRFTNNPFHEGAIPDLKHALDGFILWHDSVVEGFDIISQKRDKFRVLIKALLIFKLSLLFVFRVFNMCSEVCVGIERLVFLQSLITSVVCISAPIYFECSKRSFQEQHSLVEYIRYVARQEVFTMDDIEPIKAHSFMARVSSRDIFFHTLLHIIFAILVTVGFCRGSSHMIDGALLVVESFVSLLYLVLG